MMNAHLHSQFCGLSILIILFPYVAYLTTLLLALMPYELDALWVYYAVRLVMPVVSVARSFRIDRFTDL